MTPEERRARTIELSTAFHAAWETYEAECREIDREARARKLAARAAPYAIDEAKGRHIKEQYGSIRGFIESGDAR